MNLPIIWLVVPCYNESEILPKTSSQLEKTLLNLIESKKINEKSKIAFVNDGSVDATWEIIQQQCDRNQLFIGIDLSKNEGHQNALLAGLMTAREYADAVITLDADLQDDINAMEQFIDRFQEGNDIVYGVRSSRKKDSLFKRHSAKIFYKLMKVLGAEVINDHADYRLMSKRALDNLSEFKEVNLFLRGIVPQLGYQTTIVTYERQERTAGRSKYSFKKMLTFATDGITSFTIKPIRLITDLGILIFIVSILMLVYCIIRYATGNTVSGWASLAVSIWALGGLQLLGIGIVGEYIGKIYMETKQRPRYFIKEVLMNDIEGKEKRKE